jgi:hypothetical protein
MTEDQYTAIIERLDAVKSFLEAIQEQSLRANTLLGQARDAIDENTKTMIRLLVPPSGDTQG